MTLVTTTWRESHKKCGKFHNTWRVVTILLLGEKNCFLQRGGAKFMLLFIYSCQIFVYAKPLCTADHCYIVIVIVSVTANEL